MFRFVGGKGGVGKTTCAAALAAAAAAAGLSTLVVSTDPAPSLGDALEIGLTASPRPIPGDRLLHAVEVDAAAALRRWLTPRRATLEKIALRGTWLDQEDVTRLLQLSLPGIDEIAALLEIRRLAQSGRYQRIVIDTAPTGHTLRMLGMPAALQRLATVFDHMQDKHRVMAEALRGRWTADEADSLIEELHADAHALAALLRDPARTTTSWVTLPEPMSVAETCDALEELNALGMHVERIIVNRVTAPPPEPCRWCEARQSFEARATSALRRSVPGIPFAVVTARAREPIGRAHLRGIAEDITTARPTTPRPIRRLAPVAATLPVKGGRVWPSPAREVRLLMFGGKGGVGKTTCAAAAAMETAAADPGRNVLLLSADPAHSLGDALATKLGDDPREVPGGPKNLRARELDAVRGFEEVRTRYASAIDAVFDRLARSAIEAAHDRRVMHDLLELAPPGVDELIAVLDVAEMISGDAVSRPFDLVVLDTAPSGHALRLLQMPATVREWVQAIMSILLKYRAVAPIGDLGAVLLRLSQSLGRLRDLLSDRRRTQFIVVTRAAALPHAETKRLLAQLARLKIAVPAVLVNAAGAGTCSRCRRVRQAERREVSALAGGLGRSRDLIVAPAQMPPPRTAREMARWRRAWRHTGGL